MSSILTGGSTKPQFTGHVAIPTAIKPVAKGPMRAQAGKFTLAGDGLCVGFDSGDNVSDQYQNPGTFIGGTILGVVVDVSDESYLDLQREATGAFARD
jgi:hypothetical protein